MARARVRQVVLAATSWSALALCACADPRVAPPSADAPTPPLGPSEAPEPLEGPEITGATADEPPGGYPERLEACELLSEDLLRTTFSIPRDLEFTLVRSCLPGSGYCIRRWDKAGAETIRQERARVIAGFVNLSESERDAARSRFPPDENFVNVVWYGFASPAHARAHFAAAEEAREAGTLAMEGLGDEARYEPSEERVAVLAGDELLYVRVEIGNELAADRARARDLASALLTARAQR